MRQDLVELVNPLQGTDSDRDYSKGNTLPLVSMPFGMTSWSPQTNDVGGWFFSCRAHKLQGIRATHQMSPWFGDYGCFTIMPQTGCRMLSAKERASVFRQDETDIKPYYFRTTLGRYRTKLELTPTERCACLRFTFPPAEQARVIIDFFKGNSTVKIQSEGDAVITGWTHANNGGAPEGFACYFVAVFNRPFQSFALFQKETVWEGETEKSGDNLGAYVCFETTAAPVVELKIATSFISIAQAWQNLKREIGNSSFTEVTSKAQAVWNEALSRIGISGATKAQRQTFYTCLYRALLFPRRWHEYDAGEKVIHYSPYDGKVHDGVLYADSGFWDTYRTAYPLLTILFPELVGEMIAGWIQAYKEGGWLPRCAAPGYRWAMIGTHLDVIVPDAYLKGIHNFNVQSAYTAILKDGLEPGDPSGRIYSASYGRAELEDYIKLGYVPADKFRYAAACTQEYAHDDFGIMQMAKALGHENDYRLFRQRAFNYRNVYDPTVGFMRGRNSDGSWLEPFREFAWDCRSYIEGSAWQYSWAAPHDPAGLIELMGGKAAFVAKLDRMLSLPPHFEVTDYPQEIHEQTEMASVNFGQYAHCNEPVHHVLYLFTCAGQPWKTQYWTRRILDELYGPGPDGFLGDEDTGEMSAWYVLSALGIYPLCPGHPSYVFGSPLFKKAILQLPNGKELIIEGLGNSPKKVYVRGIRLNGKPYSQTWISHVRLLQGGRLIFVMDDKPNKKRKPMKDLPYSLSIENHEPAARGQFCKRP